ncbi:hypothetical protein ACFRQM_51735 [Streptomyces sp. NPDC056831]|uniref:hypothetical protein n=1 Tax=Streptomyces sp. NPDC056831 TaxID=3345954 RepID=UPI0036C28F71
MSRNGIGITSSGGFRHAGPVGRPVQHQDATARVVTPRNQAHRVSPREGLFTGGAR